MTGKTTHILLTFDCGAVDEDALRTLKLLAEDQDVEVTGLYVEDEDLFQAANLPGFVEVSAGGLTSRVNPQTIADQVASQVQSLRQGFETSARRLQMKFSFRTARGRVVDTLIEAAAGSDMVVISRSLRSTGLRSRHGRHFAPLLARQGNLLFINEPWRSGHSVVVLCEEPQRSGRALPIARRVARAEDLELVIASPWKPEDSDHGFEARDVVLPDWTEAAIVNLCEEVDARLLVLPADGQLEWQSLLLSLMDRLPCSVLRLE